MLVLSVVAPEIIVLPSALIATENPCALSISPPVATNLFPCCVQIPPLRVNTHTAPWELLSSLAPKIAVFPSALIATDLPCDAAPTFPVPTNLVPCWLHTPAVRVKTHAAP